MLYIHRMHTVASKKIILLLTVVIFILAIWQIARVTRDKQVPLYVNHFMWV